MLFKRGQKPLPQVLNSGIRHLLQKYRTGLIGYSVQLAAGRCSGLTRTRRVGAGRYFFNQNLQALDTLVLGHEQLFKGAIQKQHAELLLFKKQFAHMPVPCFKGAQVGEIGDIMTDDTGDAGG